MRGGSLMGGLPGDRVRGALYPQSLGLVRCHVVWCGVVCIKRSWILRRRLLCVCTCCVELSMRLRLVPEVCGVFVASHATP
jgi:hypothetical protein